MKRPGQDYLTLMSFFADGTLRQQEIKLSRNDITTVDFLPDQSLMVHFESTKSVQIISPNNENTLSFIPPEGAERFTFDQNHQNLFFLFQGDLWRVPRAELDHFDPLKKNTFRVFTTVDQFTLSPERLYYLQKGKFFSSDLTGKNPLLLEDDTFLNLAYVKGRNHSFLILRKDTKRYLYRLDENGTRLLLTTSLAHDFFENERGDILFVDAAHQLFFYSAEQQKKILLYTSPGDIRLLGWFQNGYHFLFRENGIVKLADMTFSNVYTLPDIPDMSPIYVQAQQLYFFEGKKMKSYVLP